MAQPTFLVAGVAGISSGGGFGQAVAVQVDFGTSGAVGVALQGYVDGGASAVTVISATVGGTMTGGTSGTNSLGQTTNVGGTISGGTALTLETSVIGASFLGSAGYARAARGVVTLTGVQWVQIRAGLASDGTTPDGNGKPTLVCALYEGVSAIAAGTGFVQGSTSPSQSVTTTVNDIATMVFFTSGNDSYSASASSPTVQRIRGANADAQGYNSLVWDETGVAGTTTMQGSITGAFTPTVAGTKWVVQGTAGLTVTGTITLDGMVLSGTFATGALSQLSGGITLDDFLLSGFMGLAPGRVDTNPFKNWTGTLLPGVTIPKLVFLKLSDMSTVLTLTNQVTAGDGVLTVQNAALVPGTTYVVVAANADGSALGAEIYTAA